MRFSKLAGVIMAVCAAAGVATVANAATSLHPSACVLARNGAPFDAISGATYANATFTNSSGVAALAYCPLPFVAGAQSFSITTTSAATSCTLQQMSNGGASSVIFGTHSGNTWTFTVNTNPGVYGLQAACQLANGAGIRHMVNF